MKWVFVVKDKSGRRIHLSHKQLKHILQRPMLSNIIEEMQNTLVKPNHLIQSPKSPTKYYYHRYYKNLPSPNQFLRVVVRYLNGDGFIITAYLTNKTT